jgi:hypothetical protein
VNKPNLELPMTFLTHAADVLGETDLGLSAADIGRAMCAYAIDYGVEVPHTRTPFEAPNKRTALLENLTSFTPQQQYQILLNLCEHPTVRERNSQAARKLKLQLMAKYGHLGSESLGSEVNQALIEQTQHWLIACPAALELYQQALQKYEGRLFARNLLDDLRLALEALLRDLLENSRTLENQVADVGRFVKRHGGSPELANMFMKLVDYYGKYQNTYIKHHSAVIEEEIEYFFEITSAYMKHLIPIGGAG